MASLQLPADVESWTAERVVEYVLEEFPGRVALACSFQKEESVLLDMLFELEPQARVFALDTHHLFPRPTSSGARSSAATRRPSSASKVLPSRTASGRRIPTSTSRSPRSSRSTGRCSTSTPGSPGSAATSRRPAPTRRSSPGTPSRELFKANPLADWTDDDCWAYIRERDLPYNPLHDRGYESIGDTHSTQPGKGREGRWAGTETDRMRAPHMSGFVLWFTGLSGAGKTTIANIVEPELEPPRLRRRPPRRRHRPHPPLEGARVLEGGPRHEHRPHRLGRLAARARGSGRRRLGHLALRGDAATRALPRRAALAVRRDLCRHVARGVRAARSEGALRGRVRGRDRRDFTGVSAPYEEPLEPELRLETLGRTPSEAAATVIDRLEELNLLSGQVESV